MIEKNNFGSHTGRNWNIRAVFPADERGIPLSGAEEF